VEQGGQILQHAMQGDTVRFDADPYGGAVTVSGSVAVVPGNGFQRAVSRATRAPTARVYGLDGRRARAANVVRYGARAHIICEESGPNSLQVVVVRGR
jgi:hypothetical protein